MIADFNEMGRELGTNAQNSYLAGFISLKPVLRHRLRVKNKEDARPHETSFSYKVRVLRGKSGALEVPVCFRAFTSLFGIKPSRMHNIKRALCKTGKPPVDGRGKHNNRPRKLPDAVRQGIIDFIGSLNAWKVNRSKTIYLPEDMTVKKLLDLYKEKNPDVKIAYETFRQIFVNEFNISFGLPQVVGSRLSMTTPMTSKEVEPVPDQGSS